MRKIIFLFLTFAVALSFTYAQQYTKGPVSDDDWKPITLNPDGTTAIFLDDMNGDNTVAGLEARGWVVLNEDGGGLTAPFYQGVASVFAAYEGPDTGYVAANFNGGNAQGVIDQWLISQEITVAAGDTLSFWHRSPDGSIWPDSIYVRYSTTAGITPGDFDQTWGRYEFPLSWTRWTATFSHSGTIRFAIQYYIADNATNSNFIGIDYIEVISAGGGPEPEMFLTHTPGDLNVGIFNTGAIGTEQLGATGPGVTWKGEQGLYMGGVLFGDTASASVNGVFGAFTSGGSPVLNDLKNVSSNFAGGFMSDGNFNQITEAVLYDSMAPAPYNTEIIQRSYSNTGDDFVFIRYGFINRSGSAIVDGYSGIAIDWDVGAFATNSGGYGLDNNFVYQLDTGPTSSYYFGMSALDGAGGTRATPESAFGPPFSDVRLNLYEWITTFDPAIQPDGDFRSYMGSVPRDYPVGDTIWTTFAIVAGDDLNQITTNALNASIKAFNLGWTALIIPVELTSFTANVNNLGEVVLNWTTATELNNQMFEIERRTEEGQFATIGYVEGHGTTSEPQNYSYTDVTVNSGIYFYRLKQLDFLGYYEYFDEIEVDVTGPLTFDLEQNYPNPFNPSTNIKFSVPETGNVRLAVYNLVGEEVAVLVDGFTEAGFFEVTFDASSLSSGVYFYKLQSGNNVVAKKMLLMK